MVLVGIKFVCSNSGSSLLSNKLPCEWGFIFFQNKFKVDGKFIHFVVVYLFGLCFILFFYEKNANNVQLMLSLWRENVLFLFTTCYVYIHCGLLKEYTAYSIFKIPLLIILVLNHWFKFFFQNNTYVILVFFFEAEAKKHTFSNFFLYWRSILKAIFLETWPSTLNSVVTLTFHLPFILFDLARCSKLKYLHGWNS